MWFDYPSVVGLHVQDIGISVRECLETLATRPVGGGPDAWLGPVLHLPARSLLVLGRAGGYFRHRGPDSSLSGSHRLFPQHPTMHILQRK